MMFSCKEATLAVSEGLDRRLPILRRLAVRFHVLMCRACRAYLRQVTALEAIVRLRFRDGAPPPPRTPRKVLPPEVRKRLQEAIRSGRPPSDPR